MTLHEKAETKGLLKNEKLTVKTLNEQDDEGNTVWHYAAICGTLNEIPEDLFNKTSLEELNYMNFSTWFYVAMQKQIKKIPLAMINEDLLEMKKNDYFSPIEEYPEAINDFFSFEDENGNFRRSFSGDGQGLFDEEDTVYIKTVVSDKLRAFCERHPEFEKDVSHKDPRLVLTGARDNLLVFKFKGIDEPVIITTKGVFLNQVNHNTLNETVLFIEKTFPDIEQSILLPKLTKSDILEFTLLFYTLLQNYSIS